MKQNYSGNLKDMAILSLMFTIGKNYVRVIICSIGTVFSATIITSNS